MSERYYTNSPLQLGEAVLEGPEAHHLVAVSRLRPGDAVCLFNGDGREYPAEVVKAERRRVRLHVHSVAAPERELPFPLEVAAPLPKGDRAQFLLEKLTELGVTRFVPLVTHRSVVHPRETKREKLERHVIEASKQCGRNVLMRVASPTTWETYCVAKEALEMRILAHPESGSEVGNLGARSLDGSRGTSLAVGPEGGFTGEEIQAARQAGWQVVSLGPRILRVETAAVVLTAWTIRGWQDSKLLS